MAKTTTVTVIRGGNPVPYAEITTDLFEVKLTVDANGVLSAPLDDTFAKMVDLYVKDPSDGNAVVSWLVLEAGGTYIINMG
jgi:hypothetical protein